MKTIEEFDLHASSIPAPTWSYLTSLEWIAAKENLALIGPAGTGKSHTLIALGHAAVTAGHMLKYLTAADLIETLYRGLADNTVGKTIEALLRYDLLLVDEVGFAPLDDTGAQLLFRLVAAAYERRALGIASHWSFEDWGRFLSEHTTAVSMLDRLLHHAPPWSPAASPTACARPEPGQEGAPPRADQREEWRLLLGHQRGPQLGY
ncbi:ATP-binding protein [Humibacillus xanthopallidus]|uniref:ATP-binding protein n=1 Tax=Humibacillus xanthopallidus TaxID=412689 RepID=UPI003850E5DF